MSTISNGSAGKVCLNYVKSQHLSQSTVSFNFTKKEPLFFTEERDMHFDLMNSMVVYLSKCKKLIECSKSEYGLLFTGYSTQASI